MVNRNRFSIAILITGLVIFGAGLVAGFGNFGGSSSIERVGIHTDNPSSPSAESSNGHSDGSTGYREVETLKKAREATSFTVKTPTVVPENYSLHQVMVGVDGGSYIIFYTDGRDPTISVSGVAPENAVPSKHVNQPDDSVTVNGQSGVYWHANGRSGIEYMEENGVKYLVHGPVDKNQILEIARSLTRDDC